MKRQWRSEKGFTLLELLMVVVLIGILVAIAIPNFLAAQQRARYTRAAADTKQIVAQSTIFENDNNCLPDDVTDLWTPSDTSCTGGTGTWSGGRTYMSTVLDPWSGTDYQYQAAVGEPIRAWSVGVDGTSDGTWDGATPIGAGDDIGYSSQVGCSLGTGAPVSGICR